MEQGNLEVCGGCMTAVDTEELHIMSLVACGAEHIHDNGKCFPFRPLAPDEVPTEKIKVGTYRVQKAVSC